MPSWRRPAGRGERQKWVESYTEFVRRAGFSQVAITVLTKPDTEGRLLDMVRTVADYALKSGALNSERINAMLEKLDRGLTNGTYLVVAPQFLITATR